MTGDSISKERTILVIVVLGASIATIFAWLLLYFVSRQVYESGVVSVSPDGQERLQSFWFKMGELCLVAAFLTIATLCLLKMAIGARGTHPRAM